VKIPATELTGGTDRTRDAVARTILQHGPQSAAALAERLGLSAAAIRRHLDALVADGMLAERAARPAPQRGRGRPARVYAMTEAGRAAFPNAYDDLAVTALRYLRDNGGEQTIEAFAASRVAALVDTIGPQVTTAASPAERAEALADALTAQGYAATSATAPAGVQICQHHCPVSHVAEEFPELCEAEQQAMAEVLGTHVQRLATIVNGNCACTTHVPLTVPVAKAPSPRRDTTSIEGASL
jgi:predicted ArsR family transcriptional regulator